MKNKLLYIGGTSRSGTTLLGEHLGSFKGFSHVGELMYWSIDKNNSDFQCRCGLDKCQELNAIQNIINKSDTDVLLKYWQNYENRIFGEFANRELFQRNLVNGDIILAYNNIISGYESLGDNHESDILIDNTKNIDIGIDLINGRENLSRKIYIILCFRNPEHIIHSYVQSGIRKSVVRNIGAKLEELKYFYSQSIKLLVSYPNDVIGINYHNYCKNIGDTLDQIYSFIDVHRPNGIHLDSFQSKSHLIKYNHGFKGLSHVKIQEKQNLEELSSENLVDDETLELFNEIIKII